VTGHIESEIKLRMDGAEAAREALRRLGALLERPRHFEDNVLFDSTPSRLAASGQVLRLRWTEAESILTFKGPKRLVEGVKSRQEIETSVSDPKGMGAILAGLGFRPGFRYQKYRETYRWKDAELVVDETPIGVFIEIEGPIETIQAAVAALGKSADDYIQDSYVALFFASGGEGDMVFTS
jgi:adenylate cyclase class 2